MFWSPVISATPAPVRRRDPVGVRDVSDAGLKARRRALNGTPPEVLENDELMALALPVLRVAEHLTMRRLLPSVTET